MLGYSDEKELLSLNFAKDLFYSTAAYKAFHQRISSQEFVHGFETKLRPQDNTTLDVRINARQIKNDSGEIVHVAGDVDNISEEKTLRKQLFLAQRLQGLGRVAGGLAHDFNGYVNSIMGSLTLVKPMLQNDNAADYLQEAEMAATRGAELVRRLFAFSRGIPS